MTDSPASRPLRRRSPEELGIPAAALLALADRLQAEGLDPHALLIARHGEVAFETAWAPYTLDQPALVYSASKTYTSLAIGFLADEGRLGLDDSVGELLGRDNAHGLTVRHLLTMNTGHSAEQIATIDDDPRMLLQLAPAHEPGSHFAYNSPATHALSAIVTAVTGQPLTEFLRPRLLDPLGIGPRWMDRIGGIEHGASGFHLTVDDLARTAIMLASGGVFDGAQVVPSWYVDEMARPWSPTADFDGPPSAENEVNDWSLGYGYQVWPSRYGFRLDGAAGQFGLVLPEQSLAIAYQGSTLETQAVLRAFWAFVAAVEIAGAAGGADAGAVGAAATRDSWDARDAFAIMTEAPFDSDGLRLDDDGDGWTLSLPGVGVLPVGPDWRETTIVQDAGTRETAAADSAGDEAPTHLRLATRGERRDDGGLLVHVVSVTSPHRAIVRREHDGRVHGGWHIPPLGGGWEVLRVPASVITA